jgi:hypothetical protein
MSSRSIAPTPTPAPPSRAVAVAVAGGLALAVTLAALVVYKASAAMVTLGAVYRDGGTVAPKAEWIATAELPLALRPAAGAVNYLGWVLVALAFGVIIGALVRAAIPARWLAATVGARGARGQLAAAIAGAPLMLCSCCVAPVFEGVYERTRRLGPAIGLMLAAPGLNPAALALTFLLFPAELGWGRLVLSVLLVLVGAAGIGRAHAAPPEPVACAVDGDRPTWRNLGRGFAAALVDTARRSLPAILLGIALSAALITFVPLDALAGAPGGAALLTIAVAALAVPLALPTFAEIPLALALMHAGAPSGAVLALLVAGPIINLPSLLTLRVLTSSRVAATAAGAIFAAVTAGGLVLDLLVA